MTEIKVDIGSVTYDIATADNVSRVVSLSGIPESEWKELLFESHKDADEFCRTKLGLDSK